MGNNNSPQKFVTAHLVFCARFFNQDSLLLGVKSIANSKGTFIMECRLLLNASVATTILMTTGWLMNQVAPAIVLLTPPSNVELVAR